MLASTAESSAPASTILLEATTRTSIFGSRFGEVGEPRHQPARGEHRRRGDLQVGLVGAHMDRLDRRGERIEALAQPRQRGARRFRELHAAPGALEELHAEVVLEALDLVAHRRLRDRELVRRLLEREVARRGLEYPQRIQGRQAINHDEFFLCEG